MAKAKLEAKLEAEVKTKPEFRTVSLASIPPGSNVQFWLTQDGITSGKYCEWRTVVSKSYADNDEDALEVAHDRYRDGQPSEVFEQKAKKDKSEAA